MKRGTFLSLEDDELRRMSKRANQRLLRLEDWQSKNKSGFTPAYEQARFYIGDRGNRLMRFQEDVTKLSEEEKREQRFKVTAFLNNPLSTRTELNKRKKLQKKVIEAGGEEAKGLFEKLGLQKGDKEQERKFWTLFDKAKAIGLTKTFDYRTIANLISWKLEEYSSKVFRKIAEWLINLDDFENMSRRRLFEEIGGL